MPSPTYAQNKVHIYKWKAKNVERNRELNCLAKQRFDCWKKIQKIYLNILLN